MGYLETTQRQKKIKATNANGDERPIHEPCDEEASSLREEMSAKDTFSKALMKIVLLYEAQSVSKVKFSLLLLARFPPKLFNSPKLLNRGVFKAAPPKRGQGAA